MPSRKARTGLLKHRVSVQEPTGTLGAAGGPKQTWAHRQFAWCRIEPVTGREFVEAQAAEADLTHRVWARSIRWLTEAHRLMVPSHVVTTLSVALAGLETAIQVASAKDFPGRQFPIRIDDELMLVTSGFGTTNWQVTRGAFGTAAVAHDAGKSVMALRAFNVNGPPRHAEDGQDRMVVHCVEVPA